MKHFDFPGKDFKLFVEQINIRADHFAKETTQAIQGGKSPFPGGEVCFSCMRRYNAHYPEEVEGVLCGEGSMLNGPTRLGDLIDDHCPRCKLLLNHAIASMMDGQVAKVICQTCLTEHPYLHANGAKRKKPAGVKETLFDQVLAHSGLAAEAEAPPPKKKKLAPAARYTKRRK